MVFSILSVVGLLNKKPPFWGGLLSSLDCYLCAALGPAPFNHCSTGFCGNTRTKTVCLSTVTGAGLKCSLWHILYILPKITPFSKLGLEFYKQGLYWYKIYPHYSKFYPHINRVGLGLCINATLKHVLACLSPRGCGKHFGLV